MLRENTTGATKLDFRGRGRKVTSKLRAERRVYHKKGRRRRRRRRRELQGEETAYERSSGKK